MRLFSILLCLCLLASIGFAASIDGKWVSERKMERDGNTFTIVQTFDLKSESNKVTGDVTMQFGDMEPRTMKVNDGKIDGDKFSFSVTMETPNGEMKMVYEGTVEGDTLKGTATREGGQSRPFEAKKK